MTEDADNLASLAEELALIHQVGIRLCIIHGGGKQLNEMAQKLGVVQTVIEGRRVTDDETLDLAKMVFRGKINIEILSHLRHRGIDAVGLSGVDGGVVNAVRRPPKEIADREGNKNIVDFGNVGDIVSVDTRLIELLLSDNYLPVISSLAADEKGKIFNINADTVASEIAVSLKAEKLILMTDVDGIYADANDPTTLISKMSVADMKRMIESGKATGGMIPKLESLRSLLERGVSSAHIINGSRRNALLSEVFTNEGTGTMLASI